MVGTRSMPEEVLYPVSEAAAKYGASVAEQTDDASRAYGDAWASMQFARLPIDW